jgi:hypothetical protein
MDSTSLARSIASLAKQKVDAMQFDVDAPSGPDHAAPIRKFVFEAPPQDPTLLQVPSVSGGRRTSTISTRDSSPEGSEGSHGSTKTIVRKPAVDVLGRTTEIFIKAGGEKRLTSSVPPELRSTVKSVIEQAQASERITTLDDPSDTSDGMASFPVRLEDGQVETAFLSFNPEGRVTSLDVSDDSFRTRFEATDPGKAVAGAAASTASPSLSLPALLTGVHALPRVDVSSQVRRIPLEEGRYAYEYEPRPEEHGIHVETSPSGSLWLKMVAAKREWSDTLGSGTDMVLGVAKKLDEDAFGVREIVATWMNRGGIDREHAQYAQAILGGKSVDEAMAATFSGKVASMFGFTRFEVTQTPSKDYTVKFSRP